MKIFSDFSIDDVDSIRTNKWESKKEMFTFNFDFF